jgi:hypothetical protein
MHLLLNSESVGRGECGKGELAGRAKQVEVGTSGDKWWKRVGRPWTTFVYKTHTLEM